ncbi:hypothetical protein PoB_002938800 [Plakobranchus ocellatus]|uniref:PiggyBac transposable element-derived protein 4 C-terminal zinc-ribbon domain-containing protein n=1 Tax=Plakobranchus ocellatus TaxID=259542 RepID=A0AAV4A827_9GAST|nr:hypothetical protein PoB_002938800 [Plakobranchus ocellatus]
MVRKSATSHKQFRLTVTVQLVNGYSMRSYTARQKQITELDRTLVQHHTRTVFPGRTRACTLCSNARQNSCKQSKKKKKKTRHGCAVCQMYIHKDYNYGNTMKMCAALLQQTILSRCFNPTEGKET